jgi:hypothetical protein
MRGVWETCEDGLPHRAESFEKQPASGALEAAAAAAWRTGARLADLPRLCQRLPSSSW